MRYSTPSTVLADRVRGGNRRVASAKEVRQLAERRFDGERFPVIYIDGTPYAGKTMIAAPGITEAGGLSLARIFRCVA